VPDRQQRTIAAMIKLYCRGQGHTDQPPCADCQEMLDYALLRLERCPFAPNKPTCDRCPIHCYAPAMRERVRAAMRYAGPRMLLHHPWMALTHLYDRLMSGRRIAQRQKRPN